MLRLPRLLTYVRRPQAAAAPDRSISFSREATMPTTTTSAVFQDGEILYITVAGRVSANPDLGPGDFSLELPGGYMLPLTDPALKAAVTRLFPAAGEPQPGQTWVDQEGTEWKAVAPHRRHSDRAVLVANGRAMRWDDVHRGPLGPIRLVRDVPAPGEKEPA